MPRGWERLDGWCGEEWQLPGGNLRAARSASAPDGKKQIVLLAAMRGPMLGENLEAAATRTAAFQMSAIVEPCRVCARHAGPAAPAQLGAIVNQERTEICTL